MPLFERKEITNRKKILLLLIVFSSLLISIFLGFASNGVEGYSCIFLLPMSFAFLVLFTQNCWYEIPLNIGMTFLYAIEGVRLVISPILVVTSSYHQIINIRKTINNTYGILLLAYEALAITFVLNLKIKTKYYNFENIDKGISQRHMSQICFCLIVFTVVILSLCPNLIKNYRTIVGVFIDVGYTSFEGSDNINLYSTSTLQRFLLVTGTYLLKVVRLLIPAYFLHLLKNRTRSGARILSWVLIISPLIFVDGTIARSIFYMIFLLLFYYKINDENAIKVKIPILVGAMFVLIYFFARFKITGTTSALDYFADKSVDYFAGANIVGGIFNLPEGLTYRFKYFIYDILRMVPYANTIFGLDSGDYMQTFFNQYCNTTGGQIAPTIGLGAYYFGPVLAPSYSCFFAILCKKYGRKARFATNAYYRLVYMYISFISALGIGMYSIDTTLLTLSQVILPIYIITRWSYKRLDYVVG